MSESVRSVDRALDIIEQLSLSETPIGPTRLAELTGMDKSTVHRLLSTLVSRGYAQKNADGSYALGTTLISIASRYIGSLELQTEARPFLSQLSTDLGLTTHLGVLDGCEVLYVEKLDSIPTPKLYYQIGVRMPAYCSSLGKCLLSTLSGDELSELMSKCDFRPFTSKTIRNIRELREHLRHVRRQGWAIDNEESAPGHLCVAAPIYDYRGEITAAVSASGTSTIMNKEYLPVVIETVKRTAHAISQRMGYSS